VVMSGEDYEGGQVMNEAAFTSRELARARLTELIKHYQRRDDKKEAELSDDEWHQGCMWMRIEELCVHSSLDSFHHWWNSTLPPETPQ